MQYTENYNIPCPEGTDVISRTPHNRMASIVYENMKRLDDGVTTLSESVATVVDTVERELGEAIDTVNNTLAETKEEIETEVDQALSGAVNTAPIVAGLDTPSDISGTTDYITVGYHNPHYLPIRKPRVNWTLMRAVDPSQPSAYFATVPRNYATDDQYYTNNFIIGIDKQGLYKIDIEFTIEFSGIGDGTSAMISLVKNGLISGTTVEGQYLHSRYVDLNGDGKQSVHLTAYVRQNTDTPIVIRPICEISGGTGEYNIVVSDTETITTTVTKLN